VPASEPIDWSNPFRPTKPPLAVPFTVTRARGEKTFDARVCTPLTLPLIVVLPQFDPPRSIWPALTVGPITPFDDPVRVWKPVPTLTSDPEPRKFPANVGLVLSLPMVNVAVPSSTALPATPAKE